MKYTVIHTMEKEKNAIDIEKEESQKYCFEMDSKNNQLLKLNRKNVGLVEFIIANDSNYMRSGNKDSVPKGKYNGSSAYWFSKLKAFYEETGDGNFEDIIWHCIIAVDNENSTHLNADKVGRSKIKDRLVDLGAENFKEFLETKNYDLFYKLAEKTNDANGRQNPSFASKFCHYACMNLFAGQSEQDNFSIYDNILRRAIPFYAERYGIIVEDRRLSDYRDYCEKINKIIAASNSGISRNGFDHLLWYYHKGHPITQK